MDKLAEVLNDLPVFDIEDLIRFQIVLMLRRGTATLDDMLLLDEIEDHMIPTRLAA